MAKMKFWDGAQWVTLDAKNADTIDGKHADAFAVADHTHAAKDITEDSGHRFVTDTEKSIWNSNGGNTGGGTYCSAIGMIPNDKTKAVNNYNKLVEAILAGQEILVDNVYHLSKGATASQIDVDIVIEGVSANAEFILGNAGIQLTGQNKVKVHNVKFSSSLPASSFQVLFTALSTSFIKTVDIQHCIFDGTQSSISVFRHQANAATNPEVTQYGIGTFIFSNNEVSNMICTFIVLIDTPCDVIIIEDNKIKNMAYSIVFSGITNTHSYPTQIYKAKKEIRAERNIVTCDDNWFLTETAPYYCFILFEGVKFTYTENEVSGLKTLLNIPVYDIYANCDELHYYDNIWKNNLCFYPAKQFNELMKSKGATKRFYHNNKFIVDANWVKAVGGTLANAWVTLYDAMSLCENMEIVNNTFEIYDLRLPPSSKLFKNILIANNTFTCTLLQSYLVFYRIDAGVDYSNTSIVIKGNHIKTLTYDTNAKSLIRMVDYSNGTRRPRLIRICDNIYDNFGTHPIYESLYADVFELKNNIFINNSSNGIAKGLLITGNPNVGLFIAENNVIKIEDPINMWGNYVGEFDCSMDNLFIGKKGSDSSVYLKSYNKTAPTHIVMVEHEIVSGTIQKKFCFRFTYGYDVGKDRNYVSFIGTDNVIKTVYLNRNNSADTYVTGDNTPIKTFNLSPFGDSVPTASIRNTTTSTYFAISDGVATGDNLQRRIRIIAQQ